MNIHNTSKFKISCIIITLYLLTGCTTNGNFYTGEDKLAHGEEFSVLNSILLPVAIIGVVAIAYESNQGGSRNTTSCRGAYCNYNAAWDYLPGSNEYRCRDTSNGQFVYNSYCESQLKQDNWY